MVKDLKKLTYGQLEKPRADIEAERKARIRARKKHRQRLIGEIVFLPNGGEKLIKYTD